MPVEAQPDLAAAAPSPSGLAPTDQIVSVNDRGRRTGGPASAFFVIGAIALVILIFGLLTVNIIRSKLQGANVNSSQQTDTSGLSRNFSSEAAPPLPGASATAALTARPVTCSDGSAGSELRGTDGVVVRNAAGQGVHVCPNGQVLGPTASQPAAQPIPVASRSGPVASGYRNVMSTVDGTDGLMMLNDGKYGSAPAAPSLNDPQAVLTALHAPVAAKRASGEGLLTEAPSDALERHLTPSSTPMVQAGRITNLNTLLPKGRTIDCGLSVKVVSSLAGLTTCVVTQNVYSANGRVLLIERGSEAVGEYRSSVAQGQRRLFVLWNRIITPGGVAINLQSPGADALGSTGLAGQVDNHWFERIGSAFLLSTIEDGLQYEIGQAQAQSGSSTFVLGNTVQTSDRMAQRVLEQTINIPPTIYKNQGDRAVIYVARDLDFSSVYTLRARP